MAGFRRVLGLGASVVVLAAPSAAHAAPAGPWDAFNLSPSATRAQLPRAINRTAGEVGNPQGVLSGGATTLGSGGRITLDFGQEVGGTVTVHASGAGQLGLAFAESSTFIDITSDATTGGPRGRDGAITVDVAGSTDYTTPLSLQRGGFRYLTLFLASGTSVDVDAVSVHYTAAPDHGGPERLRELLLLQRRPAQPDLVRGRLHRPDEHDRPDAGTDVAGARRAVEQHRPRGRGKHDPHRRRQARPHGLAGRPRHRVPGRLRVDGRHRLDAQRADDDVRRAVQQRRAPVLRAAVEQVQLRHVPPVDAVGHR